MPDLSALLQHWRYPAIFAVVILGNVGLPVPEETVLALGGFLAHRGDMHLPAVIAVGILGTVVGDNLGYWIGRRYGRDALGRYGHYVWVTRERLDRVSALMARYKVWAVFAARFVPGVRTLAGPVAGATGMAPPAFMVANALGAAIYVPCAVGIGYAVGFGVGQVIERFVGRAEPLFIAAIALWAVIAFLRHRHQHAGGRADRRR